MKDEMIELVGSLLKMVSMTMILLMAMMIMLLLMMSMIMIKGFGLVGGWVQICRLL